MKKTNSSTIVIGQENQFMHFQIPVLAEEFQFYLKKNTHVEIIDIHKSVDGRKLLVNVKINKQTLLWLMFMLQTKNRVE